MPEVLSVCSVQFKAVCDAIRNGRDRVVVEGDEVTLDVTCGTFITMNPGYLGRSELPGEQAQQQYTAGPTGVVLFPVIA